MHSRHAAVDHDEYGRRLRVLYALSRHFDAAYCQGTTAGHEVFASLQCCRSGIGCAARCSCRQSLLLQMPTGLFGRRWSFPRCHAPPTRSSTPACRPSATPAAAPTTTASGPGACSGRSVTFETPLIIKNPKPGHHEATVIMWPPLLRSCIHCNAARLLYGQFGAV